ncbi:MAG: glycoside hydrolase family 2 TIM barrel-domain containing protein [Bacteroidales bacterium]|nr:glycoside hydrolase family 2 TIM barrel-domain containing protein [Bacteroidales bacterium]
MRAPAHNNKPGFPGHSFLLSAMILTVLLISTGCDSSDSETGCKTLFNDGWKFQLGDIEKAMQPDYDDRDWRALELPHDWAIEGKFSADYSSGTGYLPGGIGWYRKTFGLPRNFSDKTIYLMFDGAYQNTEVWVNGKYMGKRPYGYISFYYDITDALLPGKTNVIAVRLDHTNVADSRWYTGNGIYRNVWMIAPGKVHVKPWGTYVTTPEVDDESAVVQVEVDLVNGTDEDITVDLVNEVFGPGGERINGTTTRASIIAGEEMVAAARMDVPEPARWSPESPSMYQVVTTVKSGKETLDKFTTGFGIRTIRFDPDKGFFCNGKPYTLKGICLHHDFGPLGAARHPNSSYMVLKKLKEAGANAIRTSHNPEDPYFLAMLDTMGFFVQGEAFDEWRHGKKKWIQGWNVGREEGKEGLDVYYGTGGYSDFFDAWAERDIKDMVRRDRNHPSMIMWSIGNEIDYPNDPYADPSDSFWEPGKPEPPELLEIASDLTRWVKELDTTRFVTAALANMPLANRVGYVEVLDIVGYNYQEKLYAEDHAAFPERVIYGSENGDSREAWEAVRDNAFISAQFLWTGIDYHGEAGRFPRHSAGAGIMDMCGFEKPVYYERKSWWTEAPMIKAIVFPAERGGRGGFRWPAMHWSFGVSAAAGSRDAETLSAGGGQSTSAATGQPSSDASGPSSSSEIGQTADQGVTGGQSAVQEVTGPELIVGAYSNCDEAELFLNGESLGRRNLSDNDFRERFWRLAFEPGEMKITGYRDGKQVCEDILVTAGEFEALELQSFEEFVQGDGRDIAHVTIQAVDANGVLVPEADAEIVFEVSGGGTLRAVGSGDLSSLESYQGNARRLYNGRAMVIVQSDGSKKDIVLSAAHGDVSQSLRIPVR